MIRTWPITTAMMQQQVVKEMLYCVIWNGLHIGPFTDYNEVVMWEIANGLRHTEYRVVEMKLPGSPQK